MPTGPGGLDSNGIWQYGEDDSEALASDLLNLGMASVSDALGNLVTGQVLQVVSTTKTDTYTESIAAGTISTTIVTGLTAAITPSTTESTIRVEVSTFLSHSEDDGSGGFVFRRGSTAIGVADEDGDRARISAVVINRFANTQNIAGVSQSFVDAPSSTDEITYGISLYNRYGATASAHMNRSATDANAVNNPRAVSTITLTEISG
jgi:hypothetical protein